MGIGVTEPDEKAFLQPGSAQVCAGYAVYGPQTLLVLSVGHGVQVFTLARDTGSFVLTQDDVRIPEDTKEFAINMSNMRHWEPPVKRYIDEMLAGKTGRAARTSTCAGWRRWWPTCIASCPAAASSCIRAMRASPTSRASCG